MIYQRIKCSARGWCNRKGPDGACSKCGQRPTGATWWYRFRFAGRIVHESARSTSKTLAREAERTRRRELEERINGIRKRGLPPAFARAADDWLEEAKPHLAGRTAEIYGVALENHLKPALGALLLCDIDARRIALYQARRKAEDASARTLNKELQVLRQILKRHKLWANLQGDVRFERETDHIGKALTREEEKKLLEACASNPLLTVVVTLALNTALRKSEIRTLRWSQVDLFKRTLTVGRAKTAAGSGRVVPLNAPAYAALVKWAGRFPQSKPEEYVFPACENARPDCARPYAANIDCTRPIQSWRTAWRRALKDAGLAMRFHDLRHTCITKLAEGQASEHTLMAIAGHVSRKMLEHYSHIRMEAKRAALDAIAVQPPQAAPGWVVRQNAGQQNGPPACADEVSTAGEGLTISGHGARLRRPPCEPHRTPTEADA
jgi:integrase